MNTRVQLALSATLLLLSVCVSASGDAPSPARSSPQQQQQQQLSGDGIGVGRNEAVNDDDDDAGDEADDDADSRNYAGFEGNDAFGVDDQAPPSGGNRDVDGLIRGLYRWRLRPSPELADALRAALEMEREMQELHGDPFNGARTVNDWLTMTNAGVGSGRSLPKRAPTGFTGMRGRRIPSGFNGVRGKKAIPLFSWNNQLAVPSNAKSYRDGKRAPSGFLGMRGKKSIDTSLGEQWTLDDLSLARQAKEYPNFLVLDDPQFGPNAPAPLKRVPNGFMGLRGKK